MDVRIADARRKAGYSSQEQFASAIGVPRSTLAKWEAGITRPSIDVLAMIAKELNCTVDDLLSLKPTEQN